MPTEPPGRDIYRTRMPVIIWWAWLAFALINAADLAIQWHHRAALVYGAVLAVGTGVAYACALRPRMIADEAGVRVLNPLRDCEVPWGSVRAVDVGEAVQVHFSRRDGAETAFPSWAMFSSSRAQLKADQRGRRRAAELTGLSPSYRRLPSLAKETMARSEAQIVAMLLDERAEQARKAGAVAGQPTLTWAWVPIAAVIVPVIALIALILA
jgi:Bacterial PH domain